MRGEFIASIRKYQTLFGMDLSDENIKRLVDYYELVQEHNSLLHLVAPCAPDEFATRHVLESLMLLEFLPLNTRFADVGAGAGLPSIPCLLARQDLSAIMIESKTKKSKFLEEAVEKFALSDRAKVINRQFEETDPGEACVVTCRALDKFLERLPRIIRWSKKRRLLFFGGPDLKAQMLKHRDNVKERLMPMSERRCLYIA